ncbi:2-C-methyl-D-erythritol 4-phosphate cytidylyltransferase/2-C-methyl-D-erythritol 4-phosphate cytidylyltransferase/2-C-methyl-D-erythritol 2,4-cyclodiphosphate synthase [Desulfobotulus alkaliphilus]|uniref:2-C-methyl-D-erythritol 4-phosphate cytidylyltransferase n=1 Tax=Desulfobotulus alkaliphilus TaxID=622671 RepID=A0A562RK09_9BACT|nr:2-C-methyl-D-erythritol 4-phosphate cytidylyltransferase [Desulfobotulus alkaliphilus]TWI68934.1 2-C-methyl-D-erythritol 4-phosphate cytidylyltransferase/2-C-methyl-D-erythritol 4-phosphate cytidylyltransferase/2-C-methyl-D-erythritol 2,4-cyclodiphosphate synthase [Desulfobotulus alkaliphilus]
MAEAEGGLAAVVVAGGSGIRMDADRRKQYLSLGGIPLMGHSLRTLDQSPEVESIVLVVPPEDRGYVRDHILPDLKLRREPLLAAGGVTRQASVYSGLAGVDTSVEFILVHDAVRPFLELRQISDTLDAARNHGAATLVIEVVDTLRRQLPSGDVEMMDRQGVFAVQTPQIFRSDILRKAHETALDRGWAGTDDAGLVAAMGHAVVFVPGSRTNLKVTSPEDLILAEALLGIFREKTG